MNILIINQPPRNYGDVAAHKSLVRRLLASIPNLKIRVLFEMVPEKDIEPFVINNPNVSYGTIRPRLNLITLNILLPVFPILKFIFPQYRNVTQNFFWSDYVICAPGGICLGGFQNWGHLHWLYLAKYNEKPLAFFSRSIGPFPTLTMKNRIFKKKALAILKFCHFVSLRDSSSMRFADQFKVPYIFSIDSVFLDAPLMAIPSYLSSLLRGVSYRVVVPNQLTWHITYENSCKTEIDKFYLNILHLLLLKYPNDKILMLPQLYGRGEWGDQIYFSQLANQVGSANVIVVDEVIGSDIQQTLIANSKFVIGARYHSIVFALNNCVPFISLSYEHKMTGLLEILGKMDCSVDITPFARNEFDSEKALTKIATLIDSVKPDLEVREKAHQIALNCFDKLIQSIEGINDSNH